MKEIKLLNDEYTISSTEFKTLGYDKTAANLATAILGCETPFSLGVSGKWGSGKTSIMKYVFHLLGGEPISERLPGVVDPITDKVELNPKRKLLKDATAAINDIDKQVKGANIQPIWFNPWEHEEDQEPLIALLREIHTTVQNKYDVLYKTKTSAKKITSTSVIAGLDMLGSWLKVGRNAGSNVKKIGEEYEYDNFLHIERNQRFRLVFQEAIHKILCGFNNDLGDNGKIVIFIDDLDRCEKDTVAKLLRQIKQYLATRQCVFVFGFDRHHVEKSLSSMNGSQEKETRAYLEKLFQTTIHLKQTPQDRISLMVQEIIKKQNYIQKRIKKDFADFIAEIIDPNPRRIKMFLNGLMLHTLQSEIYSELEERARLELKDLQNLTLMAYLKFFLEPLYLAIENEPDTLDTIYKLIDDNMGIPNNPLEYFIHLELKNYLQKTEYDMEREELQEVPIPDGTREADDYFMESVHITLGRAKQQKNFINFFKQNINKDNVNKYL